MRRVAALAAVLLLAACAGADSATARPPAATTPTPSAAPTRDPSKDALPLVASVSLGASAHSFQGGDDHVSLSIDNRGRDIEMLVIDTGPWLADHGLAMGSSRFCDTDLEAGSVTCGPVYSGQSMNVILRALPAHAGTFHYRFALFDREGGRLVPITTDTGAPAEFGFDEVVDPIGSQISGFHPDPSPSP